MDINDDILLPIRLVESRVAIYCIIKKQEDLIKEQDKKLKELEEIIINKMGMKEILDLNFELN